MQLECLIKSYGEDVPVYMFAAILNWIKGTGSG